MPDTELKRGTIKKRRNAQRLHQDFKHALYVISDVQNSVTHPTTMEDYYVLCTSKHFVCS